MTQNRGNQLFWRNITQCYLRSQSENKNNTYLTLFCYIAISWTAHVIQCFITYRFIILHYLLFHIFPELNHIDYVRNGYRARSAACRLPTTSKCQIIKSRHRYFNSRLILKKQSVNIQSVARRPQVANVSAFVFDRSFGYEFTVAKGLHFLTFIVKMFLPIYECLIALKY